MYAAKGRLMRKTKREKIDVEILRSIEEQLRKVGGGGSLSLAAWSTKNTNITDNNSLSIVIIV